MYLHAVPLLYVNATHRCVKLGGVYQPATARLLVPTFFSRLLEYALSCDNNVRGFTNSHVFVNNLARLSAPDETFLNYTISVTDNDRINASVLKYHEALQFACKSSALATIPRVEEMWKLWSKLPLPSRKVMLTWHRNINYI